MYWRCSRGRVWDTYCFWVYTLTCPLGIIELLFFSYNHAQCRGLGTNTCLYFHSCNFILVNLSFGPTAYDPGAAIGAPVTSWFQNPNSRLALVRVRELTGICVLPNGNNVMRVEHALHTMELVIAMIGGR